MEARVSVVAATGAFLALGECTNRKLGPNFAFIAGIFRAVYMVYTSNIEA